MCRLTSVAWCVVVYQAYGLYKPLAQNISCATRYTLNIGALMWFLQFWWCGVCVSQPIAAPNRMAYPSESGWGGVEVFCWRKIDGGGTSL